MSIFNKVCVCVCRYKLYNFKCIYYYVGYRIYTAPHMNLNIFKYIRHCCDLNIYTCIDTHYHFYLQRIIVKNVCRYIHMYLNERSTKKKKPDCTFADSLKIKYANHIRRNLINNWKKEMSLNIIFAICTQQYKFIMIYTLYTQLIVHSRQVLTSLNKIAWPNISLIDDITLYYTYIKRCDELSYNSKIYNITIVRLFEVRCCSLHKAQYKIKSVS